MNTSTSTRSVRISEIRFEDMNSAGRSVHPSHSTDSLCFLEMSRKSMGALRTVDKCLLNDWQMQ